MAKALDAAGAAVAYRAPAALLRRDRQLSLSSVFRADGSVLMQNAAARAGFAVAEEGTGSVFVRHFRDPEDGRRLFGLCLAGHAIQKELEVLTRNGPQRLLVEASPAAGSDGERLVALVEHWLPSFAEDGETQRLRDYAEAAADWFWEMNGELRFTVFSESPQMAVASAAKEFIGRRLAEVEGTSVSAEDRQALADLLEVRLPFRDFRFRCLDAEGGVRHFSLSGVPVFDGAGAFRGYRGIGRDLTLLVRAEEHAALAQGRLVEAIESIPECFMLLDAEDRLVLCNSRYREVNPAIAALLVPGTRFEDLYVASVERGAPLPALGPIGGRRGPAQARVEECEVTGRWFQVSERRTQDGGAVVVQTEITALKRRERELAEKTALLRATLDNMEQGLLVLDREDRVVLWNEQLCGLFELESGELYVGRPIGDVAPLALAPEEEERLGGLAARGSIVLVRRLESGRLVEVRFSAMPDGRRLATFADITQRTESEADLRRAKEEAELASRGKTEFLANMSHELRTPLNAIIGFADILTGQIFGSLGDPRYADYAGDIRDSGQHLLTLINDILDVSKVEVGKVELIEEPLDAAAVLESCARLMRERADAAGVRLDTRLPEDLPFVHADGRRLKQIVLNLLSNAVKFTPPGGRVTVRASAGPDGFRIAVADTGIGIAPEDLDKAMRPFGQIDSRLARKYQGTGLGLPLTKSLIELHEGRLELKSAVGEGTTATIWLPPGRLVWAEV